MTDLDDADLEFCLYCIRFVSESNPHYTTCKYAREYK